MPTDVKTRKRLKPIPWAEKTGLTARMQIRTVKMIAAVCSVCSKSGGAWWNDCPHDPYHSMQAIEDPAARFAQQDDGTYVEDTSKTQVIKSYRKIPNIRQVPLTIRVDSGLSVDMQLAKGWKMLSDVKPPNDPDGKEWDGYAPVCEGQNCYAPDPKIRTRHDSLEDNKMVPLERYTAYYCSERHAKRARLKDSEQIRYVSEVNRASAKSARAQLAAVSL